LFRGVPGVEHCTVCEVGNVADKILVNRLWSQVLAHMVLSTAERKAFTGMKLVPVPAASWLLGRIAAKDAVRMRAGLEVGLADVEVRPDIHGRPEASCAGRPGPLVSLAHTGFAAVAAAADRAALAGVGIDIEAIAPLAAGLKEDAFTAREREIIAAAEPGDLGYLAAWGVKEAVGKALGRGVVGGPLALEVTAFDPASGRLHVVPHGAMAQAFPDHARGLDAYRRVRGDKVITLCLLARGDS
jgi:phosphopantetheinyl transferase